MSASKGPIEGKIEELKNQTTAYVSELRQLIEGLPVAPRVNVLSYFTASLNISHDPKQESLCIGSYHIRNIGSEPLTNPNFCIKLPIDSPFTFSGQYVYEYFSQNLKNSASWERINDQSEKEEFWLKPLQITSIEPNEMITFSNFQLIWTQQAAYEGSITAVTYCDQLQEGMAAINPINLSGTVPTQGDEYE